ncbi:hypothetical protein [Paraburkholderia nodosa]|uniref:hypothetical protein n=1 Tax=Paraburkholderia nodosa TaxID=392320 RepID=UPI0012B68C2B|nr:hypothetical protein [Paraburkholderia nodosa]
MKDLLIIIPAGSQYSTSVIHQQTEVSSLRLDLRQLTKSDPAGQCQALITGLIFTLSRPDMIRNPNDLSYFDAS